VVTIRRAGAGDVARVALTASRAFADDPVMRWFLPDADEYEEISPRLIAFMSQRWQATDSQWCTDDGAAMAGWIPPGRPVVDVEQPAIEHPPWRLERFAAIGAAMAEHTPPDSHWYLNMLATHPDWQRQGLGAALMGAVFETADAARLACYLETETLANVAYYRHHGFDVRSEWDVSTDDSAGPHMWGMLRPAR
jgi:ribosomal protein S18 acetylase RimI-like enzyme